MESWRRGSRASADTEGAGLFMDQCGSALPERKWTRGRLPLFH